MAALAVTGRPVVCCNVGAQHPCTKTAQQPVKLRFGPSLKLSRRGKSVIAKQVCFSDVT